MTVDWNDVAQILTDAKAHMLEHGRCTGRFVDDETRVCLAGAVYYAAGVGMANDTILRHAGVLSYVQLQNRSIASYPIKTMLCAFELLGSDNDSDTGIYYFNDTHNDGDVFARLDEALATAKEYAA
jgi:hypothetical protein